MNFMKNFFLIDHPLVKRDLTLLRDKNTPSNIFRAVLRRTASLMAYEVTRDLRVKSVSVETPLEKTHGYVIRDSIILIPILRAGLGLVGGFIEIIPDARVGHIGLYRDEETLMPIDYYLKTPNNLKDALVLVLDPMLATGGSAKAAVSFIKKKGARKIRFVSIVAAPKGLQTLHKAHPDVIIYACAFDRQLDSKGYILPGLGDAGDRIFGTGD